MFPPLVGQGLYALRAERLLVRHRHAGELPRGPPRPARRPHPLAADRRAGRRRAGSTTARDRLAGAVLEAPCHVAAGATVGRGRARRRRQLGGGRRRRSRRARGCAAPSCRSARAWGRAPSSRTPIVGAGAQVGAARRRRRRRRRPPASSIRAGATVAAGERVFPGARVGARPMSRTRRCSARSAGSATQLRDGTPPGHAALGPARAGAAAVGDRQRARRLGRSAAASPRRCGAIRCACPDRRRPRRRRCRAGSGPGDLVRRRSSYCGATAETLAAARAAASRAAPTCRRDGGRAARRRSSRRPAGTVVRVPGGLPPRAALGSLLRRARRRARARGRRCRRRAGDIRAAAHACDAVAADRGRQPRGAARRGRRRATTWVYGSARWRAVARRLKSQLNENAKSTAAFGELPEADHNEIVGWAGAARTGGRPAAILPRAIPTTADGSARASPTTPRRSTATRRCHRVLDRRGRHARARARSGCSRCRRPRLVPRGARRRASTRPTSTASPAQGAAGRRA